MSILQRLSFNHITADPWTLEVALDQWSRNVGTYIAAWRHKLDRKPAKAS